MNDPAVLVLLVEQGDRSLEDHTEDFVFLANYTHYPDNCLCSFYFAGLITTPHERSCPGRALERDSPLSLSWVLVSCESLLTVDYADNDTSPTQDPEPSPPSPRYAEL
ncbi:hypothetical protein M9458_036872, partial [Cirrhinus mrigala]